MIFKSIRFIIRIDRLGNYLFRQSLPALMLLTGTIQMASAATPVVRTIDWSSFRTPAGPSQDLTNAARLLNNSLRYNLEWMDDQWAYNVVGKYYESELTGRTRAGASAALAAATALSTGLYDPFITGVDESTARNRTAAMIKGLARKHRANGATGSTSWGSFGHGWPHGLRAGLLGQAGWMLWDDIDTATRQFVSNLVSSEAALYISSSKPYSNGSGDTKAEENSADAMVVCLAAAMFSVEDPNQHGWRNAGSELMISAFARPSDQVSSAIIDGINLSEFLNGYNIQENGTLYNHDFIHPDYFVTTTQNLRSRLLLSLVGEDGPEASTFNSDIVYGALSNIQFDTASNFQAPGGTIYVTNQAQVYYPQGTDGSVHRIDIYYVFDVFADLLNLDMNSQTSGNEWANIRSVELLARQARHVEGKLYASGEWDEQIGKEQMAAWMFADAALAIWLSEQGRLTSASDWIPEPTETGSNLGFETAHIGSTWIRSIPYWETTGPHAGMISEDINNQNSCPDAPEGTQMAYLDGNSGGSSMYQFIASTAVEGDWMLTLAIGDRTTTDLVPYTVGWFVDSTGDFFPDMALSSATNPVTPDASFEYFEIKAEAVPQGANIYIRVFTADSGSIGQQVLIDDVSVQFTPSESVQVDITEITLNPENKIYIQWQCNLQGCTFTVESSETLTPDSWSPVVPETQWPISDHFWTAPTIYSSGKMFFRVKAAF